MDRTWLFMTFVVATTCHLLTGCATPGPTSLPEKELRAYSDRVRLAFLRHWKVPKSCLNGFKSRLAVLIDSNGNITHITTLSNSGDPTCLESTIATVRAASPLPIPPPSLAQLALEKGFTIDFVGQTSSHRPPTIVPTRPPIRTEIRRRAEP